MTKILALLTNLVLIILNKLALRMSPPHVIPKSPALIILMRLALPKIPLPVVLKSPALIILRKLALLMSLLHVIPKSPALITLKRLALPKTPAVRRTLEHAIQGSRALFLRMHSTAPRITRI